MLAICGNLNAKSKNDAAYRYKMPQLQTKFEGRGNGSKTCIVNCLEVANSLHRTPGALTKFFANELGTISTWDGLRAIVNGHHQANVFPPLLDKFIDLFVLCPNCLLPETRLSVQARKNGNIFHKCASCGEKTMVDMTHKLCTFIIKDAMAAQKLSKGDKKKKKKKKKDDGGDEESKEKKKKKDKKDKKKKKKKKKKDSEGEVKDDDEDEDANSDASNESFGEAQLGADDGDAANAENVEIDEGEALAAAVDTLSELIAGGKNDEEDLALQCVMAQTNGGFAPLDRTRILYKALAKLDKVGPTSIESFAGLFKRVVKGEAAQLVLIGAVEMHYGVDSTDLCKLVPLVLKAFFDHDILSESILIGWFKAMAPSEHSDPNLTGDALALVKSKAAVFVHWLEENDEEESGSDSGSDSGSGSD